MKKTSLLVCCIAISTDVLLSPLKGQAFDSDVKVLNSVAEHVLAHTSYEFIDSKSGVKYATLSPSDYSPELEIASPYNTWSSFPPIIPTGRN